jgi:chemotaxis protein CheX
MTIHDEDVYQMTNEIWGGMLQMDLQPAKAELQNLPSKKIGACVQITGAWEGAVRVDCSLALARVAAARFLGEQPEAIAIDQIRDAMGELANMSAGSVKPLLPKPCQLSLPSVADGSDYHFSIPNGEVLLVTSFEFEREHLVITILQRRPQ